MPTAASPEEISARARAIYDQTIAPQLTPQDVGRFVVVDVATGDFVIDSDELAAFRRAREEHPGGTLHLIRVGYRTVGRIGGRMRPVER